MLVVGVVVCLLHYRQGGAGPAPPGGGAKSHPHQEEYVDRSGLLKNNEYVSSSFLYRLTVQEYVNKQLKKEPILNDTKRTTVNTALLNNEMLQEPLD